MNKFEIFSQIPWADRKMDEANRRVQINCKSICAELKKQGVAYVSAGYNGGGDDGQIQDVSYIGTSGGLVEVDEKSRVNVIPDINKPNKVMSVSLGLGLDMLLSDGLVAGGQIGWENNCGGEGTMKLSVETQALEIEHYERVETLADPVFLKFF